VLCCSELRREFKGPNMDYALNAWMPESPHSAESQLDHTISKAQDHIISLLKPEGYWVFDLEADVTIPSEYLLLQRFLNRDISSHLSEKIARYIRNRQLEDGGWPLFEGGKSDISATVKAYFALKIVGDTPDAAHMIRARELILSMGGAVKVNVFTRITLALFGQVLWRATPAMPIEIMLLPDWFFFHLHRVSYWSRTVIVPLLILYAKQPVCALDPSEGVRELFIDPPEELTHLDHFSFGQFYKNLFTLLDRVLKRIDGWIPQRTKESALRHAEQWALDRMQGEGGIGAIFPAMANAVMALKTLGYPDDHADYQRGLKALDDLIVYKGDEVLCQPCLSPIWDTCLSTSALLESGISSDHSAIQDAVKWLFSKQIFVPGDWCYRAPDLESGGWAFEFENDFYPDLDDTPMVAMAILRGNALASPHNKERIAKAINWILGMQSSDGGWGAFDIDNNNFYLNHIPFADHGALLDPSTSDLTARCIELLSMLGYGTSYPPIERGLRFLRNEQEESGAWFGRWGVNYIYGTWAVLSGLRQVGEDMSQPYIRKAVAWLKSCQNEGGGWGETCYSYNNAILSGKGKSTASQTAWSLLGLLAAGETDSESVRNGIDYLCRTQNSDGGWDETQYTGTGFPRVFYLRYHGYSQYFPLWALGVYRRQTNEEPTRQEEVRLQNPADLYISTAN
jgi:squalene-hopene/tetraprenyl-beta-curcumene cyclase